MNQEHRNGAEPPASVVVITPSVGRDYLGRCSSSVQEQDYPSVKHLIVIDGEEHAEKAANALAGPANLRHSRHVHVLPENTGCGRYNGYRICAAFSYLVNEDVVIFLDDDNWFDSNHVSSCLAAMKEHGVDWVFALRRICKADGSRLVDDDCDSTGFWRRYASYQGPSDLLEQRFIDFYSAYPFQIDTSCFAIKRTLLTEVAALLLDGDCFFANHLIRNVAGACTGLRTVNYRARQDREQSLLDYYSLGNRLSQARYCGRLPWKTGQRCESRSMARTDLRIDRGPRRSPPALGNRGEDRNRRPGIAQHPDRKPLAF